MKKIISILTATRAEFGLLKPLIAKLNDVDEFDIRIVVTGAHLSPEFGLTYNEIEHAGFRIDKKIEILLSADTPSSISKAMGLAMISFADYFDDLSPDMLIVLGDRYESLAVVTAAMNQRIPVAHLYGGETIEGTDDVGVRHAITKLSHLHFTSNSEFRKRVIQLGEEPNRVFNVGALGIENILNEKLLSKETLFKSLDMPNDKRYAVVNYHSDSSSNSQIIELLEALKERTDLNFIITKAGTDSDSKIINSLIDEFAKKCDNIFAFSSLGMIRYLSSIRYSDMVIGNSSSGLVEVPSFHKPTINVGDRQKSKLKASSVIDCELVKADILVAITKALSGHYKFESLKTINPYGDGQTSEKIVAEIKKFLNEEKIELNKKFYDLEK